MADFGPTAEQEQLRDSVRSFFRDKAPISVARTGGADAKLWRQMALELGLQGLAIPEVYGGSGFSRADRGIVFQEAGRCLLAAPLLATSVLAVEALLATGDEDVLKAVLPAIAAGEIVATVALDEPGRPTSSVRAVYGADGWRLTGSIRFVLDGAAADVLLVAAQGPSRLSLFLVEGTAAGLRRTAMTTLDLTRAQARLDFDAVPGRLVGADGTASPVLARTLQHAVIALAAEQVGGAQRCLEMAIGYAKTRVQFGQPIGSFQAIKHKCANVLLEVESARSAALYAASIASGAAASAEAGGDDAELLVAAALAGTYCSQAFFRAATESIQIHGGIGFTWEHDAHLYYRRAKSGQSLFGTAVTHRRTLATALGLVGPTA